MASFLHPGVYVIEVGNPPRAIEAASTSTTIFVGETERGPVLPYKLTSRTDYSRVFGGYLRQDSVSSTNKPTLAYAMDAFFGNGGTTCYVLRAMSNSNTVLANVANATATRAMAGPPKVQVNASSAGTWANGSATNGVSPIFLPVFVSGGSTVDTTRFRIAVVYTPLDTGVQTIVEDWDRLSADPNDESYVVDTLNRSQYIVWDPGTAPAVPAAPDIAAGAGSGVGGAILPADITAAAATGKFGLGTASGGQNGVGGNTDAAASGSAPYGDLQLGLLQDVSDASLLVIGAVTQATTDASVGVYNSAGTGYVLTRPHLDLFYIGQLGRHHDKVLATDFAQAAAAEFNGPLTKTDFAAVYVPWIKVSDPVGVGKNPLVAVGPAATMSGVYARTDANRGVWKAPAGVEASLLGTQAIEFNIQDIQQDILNPLGINAIRNIPGAGAVSWGARTMMPGSQWRYINVRRMAIFLRISIYNGIQFAVFEGNDEPLWASLRLTVGGFMDSLYRQGAFAGSSPSEAFFVKVDAETTTPSDQIAGVVNVLVGFSPLRPAEFVIVKLSQIVKGGG
jgi:phage tail sheath protein FI